MQQQKSPYLAGLSLTTTNKKKKTEYVNINNTIGTNKVMSWTWDLEVKLL